MIGMLFSSVVAFSVGYFGYKSRRTGPDAAVVTPVKSPSDLGASPVQSAPVNAGASPAANVSMKMNAQQSLATHFSGDNLTKNTFPDGKRGPDGLSKGTQTREGGTIIEKRSGATPQQLWSAVQSGDSNAAVLLADHYLRGDGVPVNCLQARVLLLVASEKKNPTAIRKLRELDQKGCS
jgi:TPR repeat protein